VPGFPRLLRGRGKGSSWSEETGPPRDEWIPLSPGLARLFLESFPLPACLVRAGGKRLAWSPSWEDLERNLGKEEFQGLLDRAGSSSSYPFPGGEAFLLSTRGRWFRLTRVPFLGGMDPLLWTIREVTEELGLFFREREDRLWMERTLRSLGAWSGDPPSFARALAGSVSERTGLESVQVYWKSPSRRALFLLGGTEDSQDFPGEISLEDRTPLGWTALSGRRKILEPAGSGGEWDWDPLERMWFRRVLLLPLLSQGQVLGVLLGGTRRFLPPFAESLLRSLETVCRAASDLLNMGELYRESRASEGEWKRVFFALDHPLLVMDQEGRILQANPAAARALGLENPSDLVGLLGQEVLHGSRRAPKDCLVRRTLRSGRSAVAYRDLPRLGGRCLVSAHPLPGKGGEPSGAILFVRRVEKEGEDPEGGEGGTEGASQFKELRRQRDMLARFLGTAAGIFRVEDLNERLYLACKAVREAGLFRRVSLGVLEGEERRFKILASLGGSLPEEVLLGELEGFLDPGREGAGEERFRIGNSFFIPVEARLPGEAGGADPGPWRSRSPWREGDILLVPLQGNEGKVMGLFVLEDPFDGMRPSEGTVRALELLAGLTLSAMEHSLLGGRALETEEEDEVRAGGEREGEDADLPRGKGQPILVVDDEEAVLHLFQVFLDYLGYRFLPAGSAGKALEILDEKGKDVAAAVVDFSLSGMDGRALAEALKAKCPGLPVVLTSGFLPPSGGKVVEDAFLAKPFHLEDLARLLHTLVV